MHTIIVTRGEQKRPQKIQINRFNKEPILLPVVDQDHLKQGSEVDTTIYKVNEFAELHLVSRDNALKYAIQYSDSITQEYLKLNVVSVESYPDLGDFIIFRISPDHEMIYLKDISTVKHDYWKQFFSTAKRFDDHWFFRKAQ
jgi:hypothetical protein